VRTERARAFLGELFPRIGAGPVDAISAGDLLDALSSGQPISENTMSLAIRRLGFHAASHGARHLLSTIANENALARSDVIEAALAHAVAGVRGRYNVGQARSDSG
jgi:hypothetical protein